MPFLLYIHVGALIGYTNIGDVNSHLMEYEKRLSEDMEDRMADSMLVLMVKGLFSKLQFAYAQ